MVSTENKSFQRSRLIEACKHRQIQQLVDHTDNLLCQRLVYITLPNELFQLKSNSSYRSHELKTEYENPFAAHSNHQHS